MCCKVVLDGEIYCSVCLCDERDAVVGIKYREKIGLGLSTLECYNSWVMILQNNYLFISFKFIILLGKKVKRATEFHMY